MKRFLKIFLFTILSLVTLLIIAVGITLWVIFTPEKLTGILRQQTDKFIVSATEIGEVELTFFSTFPQFGIKVNQFTIINPPSDAPNDTLISVGQLSGTVDVKAWWEKNELILNDIKFSNGSLNVFIDSLGNTNFDVFIMDSSSNSETKMNPLFQQIDINEVGLENINLRYVDQGRKLHTHIQNLTATISGQIYEDRINGQLEVDHSNISFEMGGMNYLPNAYVKFKMPFDFTDTRQMISLQKAQIKVNNLELAIEGNVEKESAKQNIITDINYHLDSWQIGELVALIPPPFHQYVEGMKINGLVSSKGKIKGILNDSTMPIMDIHLLVKNGSFTDKRFHLPVSGIDGDIQFYSDLKSDDISYIKINDFKAKTPQSSVTTKGTIKNLFSDLSCNLTSNLALSLGEWNNFIPTDLKATMSGKLNGNVKSIFRLSQLQKMQLDKIRLSGNAITSNLNITYNGITLATGDSNVEFSLPNPKSATDQTRFALIKLISKDMVASNSDGLSALFQNAQIDLETSDARDTTIVPNLIVNFKMDSLYYHTDTMGISISKPTGKFSISPKSDASEQPEITMVYQSENLKTHFGEHEATIKKINIDGNVVNDKNQKDIFLQWLVKGFIEIEDGLISIASLNKPLELPSIKLDFEPESIIIKESSIKIDKSDFQLTGRLDNLVPYMKGDSLLRGQFDFVSNATDIVQLMNLTSGIGYKEESSKPVNTADQGSFSGPYFVPKGIDIQLNTRVKSATYGESTASDITGELRIRDGVMVLDQFKFVTPAAAMQLTSMYRTPRKNHIYLAIDYHMFDVEISELLEMIPDMDTLMPMLRSFGGKGEFHFAGETYLDSLYNIKKSTLRGASSIKGQDLVLMDGETFSEIAKTLKFNKKTENRVDSLSAEFTIYKDEIDVYPFLMVMDKYKAVIVGRHNFDLSYNYHISVVDCPLPIRLGIDVKGTADAMKYSQAKCRYADQYRPVKRFEVEKKKLELSQLIRNELRGKVPD